MSGPRLAADDPATEASGPLSPRAEFVAAVTAALAPPDAAVDSAGNDPGRVTAPMPSGPRSPTLPFADPPVEPEAPPDSSQPPSTRTRWRQELFLSAPVSTPLPPFDSRRFYLGLCLLIVGLLLGAALCFDQILAPMLAHADAQVLLGVLAKAAVWAYIPVGLYMLLPYVVDRYDPEPWWALTGVFFWGALFATGVAGVVNARVGQLGSSPEARAVLSAVVSAPLVEEAAKALAILGVVMFLREEFDGVVDGVVYATYVAIGFAATENIVYYWQGGLKALSSQQDVESGIRDVFLMRGIMTPWLHPLFTAMTGIGFGMGRESDHRWARLVYPLLGFLGAVGLHAVWNGLNTAIDLAGMNDATRGGYKLILISVGGAMAFAFLVIVAQLVVRKGRTIRSFLGEEVLRGTITSDELDLICSPIGPLRARLSWRGRPGARFVKAGARLALSKWHTARAVRGRGVTLSMDRIGPLRRELARQRLQMLERAVQLARP